MPAKLAPVNSIVMRKGAPAAGLEFFQLLHEDDEFSMELGRAVLVAGRLESELTQYLNESVADRKIGDASLGRLVNFARKHQLLTKMLPVLEILTDQRNYLSHNIHALFAGVVEETVLDSSNLLDSDVDIFTERARQLKENLNGLADIIREQRNA